MKIFGITKPPNWPVPLQIFYNRYRLHSALKGETLFEILKLKLSARLNAHI